MPKVSIIIPVYNAEKYLCDTIRSIQAQTQKDWEAIIVDDCSTDSTSTLCEELAREDPRLKYVRQPANGGPSAARNAGLNMALGTYLAFVDSDDTIENDFLQKMLDAAESHDADVVWCNFYEERGAVRNECSHGLPSDELLDNRDALSFFLTERIGLGSLCNKLYRRAFIENSSIRLNTKRAHGEDWEFNMNVFEHNPRIVPIVDVLYHYVRQNEKSVIASYRPFDYDTFVHSLNLKRQLAATHNLAYDECTINSRHIYMVLSLLMTLAKSSFRHKLKEFRRIADASHFRNLLSAGTYSTNILTIRYKVYLHLVKARLYRLAYLAMKMP